MRDQLDIEGLGRDSLPGEQAEIVDAPPRLEGRTFEQGQHFLGVRTNCQHVRYVLEDIDTTMHRAEPPKLGVEVKSSVPEHRVEESSTSAGPLSARTGNARTDTMIPLENTPTNVLAVRPPSTALTPATSPSPRIQTPLVAAEWKAASTRPESHVDTP